VILCAPLLFSTRSFVLFDDDATKNEQLYVQNVLKEDEQEILFCLKFKKTLNICALKLLHEKHRAKSKRGDKKKREKGRDFSVRLQV